MNKKRLCSFLLLLQILSCSSQTETEIITTTCNEVLVSIEKLDTTKFISLIGRAQLSDISKNEEIIGAEILRAQKLLLEIQDSTTPRFFITNTYNFLGQRRVIVPLRRHKSDDGFRSLHLNLLFGPPNMFSLEKISGYSFVINESDSLDFRPLEYWNKSN